MESSSITAAVAVDESEEETRIIRCFKLVFGEGIVSDTPLRIGNTPQTCQVLAIRHALSEYNVVQEKLYSEVEGWFHEKMDVLRQDASHIDTPLHALGKKQCLSQQKHVNRIDTRLVLVSPLRRTLQTAMLIFQEHPNKENIKFLVFPLLSEQLNTSCCISEPSAMEETAKEAAEKGIIFDFSMLQDKQRYSSLLKWQVDQIVDQTAVRKQKEGEFREDQLKEFQIYLRENQNTQAMYENWDSLIKRAVKLRNEVRDIASAQTTPVCIVSHGNTLKCLTNDGSFDEKGWVIGKQFKNAEMAWLSF